MADTAHAGRHARRPAASTPCPRSPGTPSPPSARRSRPTARASASRWRPPSSRRCRWRWPASCGWPGAPTTPGRRSPRPSRAPTRWAGARRGRAARPTPCSRPTGSAPGSSWRELSATAVAAGVSAADGRVVRRAGVRLHRRAVGGLGRRPHRRAGDHRPGAAALPRPAGRRAAAGRGRRRGGRGRRARRLEAAAHADRRPPARGAGPAGAGPGRPGRPDAERARPARGAWPWCSCPTWAGGRAPGCCGSSPTATRSSARPGRGGRSARRTPARSAACRCARRPSRSTPSATSPRSSSPPTPRRWPTCASAALAPLADVRPATAEKLEATLRSWLLHQGRREDVAADLFVHPQTVRYRMGQLRELYGDALDDPQTVLSLTLALA